MEETSNTAVLARLAAMEASMEARLENALAGLMEKLNNITLPNYQFRQQLPLHGSQPSPPTTMHDQVAPNQRIELVAFSMKGDALTWYKWMFNTNQLTS
ncbi:hypothetical protein Lal_00028580 [Lupinus albus]|nr:hypothetical protein Lal_00028580 [Lupinus albus]